MSAYVELLQQNIANYEKDYSYWLEQATAHYRSYRLHFSGDLMKEIMRDGVRFDLRMARLARAGLRKWNALYLAELERHQPAPSVRIVSAVPVAPVQLTLAGEADPVPADPVRPSWYARRIARGPSRWRAGMCL